MSRVYVCVCVCMCMYVCVCVYVCVYANVVFKNGKGSMYTGTHAKGCVNPASWRILCELTIVWAKQN